MSKHTFTPGPWNLHAGRAIETQDGTFTIHKCNDWNPEKIVELDQIAHLIASAPDLLEACQYLIANCGGDSKDDGYNASEWIEQVYIAIQKAKTAIARAEHPISTDSEGRE